MALINCPECKKEISDHIYKCIHCGFKISDNLVDYDKVSFKLPLIISIIYLVCVYGYNISFSSFEWIDVIYLILGIILPVLFTFGNKIISKQSIEIIFVFVFSTGVFLFAFNYNLARVFSGLSNWRFFDFYDDSLGVFLAIYQIFSIVTVFVFVFSLYFDFIGIKAKALISFVTSVVGFSFLIYEIIYINNKWGTPTFSYVIWFVFCTLTFHLTGFALQIEKLKVSKRA